MDNASETQILGLQLPRAVEPCPAPDIYPIDCRHSDAVLQIAAESFPSVWSEKEFQYFLSHENRVCSGLFSLGGGKPRLRCYFIGLLVQGDLDIISVATRADDRRLGLGERLLVEVCKDPRILRAFLEVEVDNEAAIALYRKTGFVILGRRNAYYGPERDAYLMRWEREPS